MRYQFQSHRGQLSWRPKLIPDAIKVLIGINLTLFILKQLTANMIDLDRAFGLSPSSIFPMIWQSLTYIFMHGNIWHLAVNMLVLWMFGSELESIWGRTEFLKYFLLTGIGSGLIWLLFNLSNPGYILIGASGAVYGILLAYGLMFPNRTVMIYFVFPLKVKWFVLLIGAVAFLSSISTNGNISHLTHLSGMLIGLAYLKSGDTWKKTMFKFKKNLIEKRIHKEEEDKRQKIESQRRIDTVLDKISKTGYDGLTEEEKKILFNTSRDIAQRQQKD